MTTVRPAQEFLRRRMRRGLMKAADRRIWAIMTQIFDMDDRARLPWRFFGATLTILAQL